MKAGAVSTPLAPKNVDFKKSRRGMSGADMAGGVVSRADAGGAFFNQRSSAPISGSKFVSPSWPAETEELRAVRGRKRHRLVGPVVADAGDIRDPTPRR